MPTQTSLASTIQTLRVLRGLCVEQLADRAQIPPDELQSVEAGQEPSLNTLIRLCLVFGVDPHALQEGVIQRPESDVSAGRVFLFSGDTDTFRTSDLGVFSRALSHGRFFVTHTKRGAAGLQQRLRLRPLAAVGMNNAGAARQGHRLAQTVRLMLGLHSDPIRDLRVLIEERLGIVVCVDVLRTPRLRAGAVLDLHRAGAAIVLRDRAQRAALRRVELAHELCHLLFDPLDGSDHVQLTVDIAAQNRPSATRREARARGFAAELLVPRAGLLRLLGAPRQHHIERADAIIEDVQRLFGAPRQLTVHHLTNTGYFDDVTRYQLLRGPSARFDSTFATSLPASGALPLCFSDVTRAPEHSVDAARAWRKAADVSSGHRQSHEDEVARLVAEAAQVDAGGRGSRAALVLSRWVFERAERGLTDQIEALYHALRPEDFSALVMPGFLGATFSLQDIAAEARDQLVVRSRQTLRAVHRWPEEQIHRATRRF